MRVHHVAFRTHDLSRLEKFYTEVLGLTVKKRDGERSLWLDVGGAILMLERAETGEPSIPSGSFELLAFTIMAHEKKSRLAALAAAGVAVEGATDFTIYFRDPDGRRIGLSHFIG